MANFIPTPGEIYENRAGGSFLCKCVLDPSTAIMENTESGWTFEAHHIERYPDGKIEWCYSVRGYFQTEKANL